MSRKFDGLAVESKSRNVYLLAIAASEAITMMSARKIAQPLIQPSCGPNARVTQANVVPASGSARLKNR